jgi:hypothetical protein
MSRSHWCRRILLVALPIIAGVMALDLIAISTDFHDADGIIDCWPHCTTWHHLVGWSLSVGALLLLVLVLAVLLREGLHKGRGGSR